MDLYSRKIIAWVLSETLKASHVVECVEKAKKIRSITQPLIIHTDRGCQYVSDGIFTSYYFYTTTKTMALCIDCHDKLHAGKLD